MLYLSQIVARNGRQASRLCSKDPYALSYATTLARLFPRARFVLLLRDGRAVVASLLRNRVRISGFDLSQPLDCLRQWSTQLRRMWLACAALGPHRCFTLRYEHLVLRPRESIEHLLRFLDLVGGDHIANGMLDFWKRVGLTGRNGISVSRSEKSSQQIRHAVHSKMLQAWRSELPPNVLAMAPQVAPMLQVLGYL